MRGQAIRKIRLLSAKKVVIYRNPDDAVTLEEVEDNVLQILSEEDALLIAEVIPTENPLEHEVKQVYNATILH